MHIGVFILLLLSGERNFGVRLNKPYTATIPMDIPVFTGEFMMYFYCVYGVHGLVFSNVVRFGVFMVVTMKNGAFWDVTPCGCGKDRSFGGT
jgi:hypothetical protein